MYSKDQQYDHAESRRVKGITDTALAQKLGYSSAPIEKNVDFLKMDGSVYAMHEDKLLALDVIPERQSVSDRIDFDMDKIPYE